MGPRDANRQAFAVGLISDGEQWMNMIVSRNRTSDTYNQATADAIVASILTHYRPLFKALESKLESLMGGE